MYRPEALPPRNYGLPKIIYSFDSVRASCWNKQIMNNIKTTAQVMSNERISDGNLPKHMLTYNPEKERHIGRRSKI